MQVRADRDVLSDGQTGERLRDLERARDAAPREQMGGEAGDLIAAVEDAACGRQQEPGDDREQRGLAGAVRSDQRHDLSLLHGERRMIEREQPAETARDVFHAQHFAHARLESPAMPRGANATTAISTQP